jgi:hypothetical protein
MESRHIQFKISDNEFLRDKIARFSSFKKVDLKQLKKVKPKASDIAQRGIGNCYFLSALGNILEQDPNFLDQVLKVKEELDDNGKKTVWIEVTFHDIEDPNKKFTYKLEPTKVLSYNPFKKNAHKHDAIYLLEKAYAIHRMVMEKDTYTDDAAVIIDALLMKNFDSKKTYTELKTKRVRIGQRGIKLDDIKRVKQKGVVYLKAAEEISKALDAEKNDVNKALERLKAGKFKIGETDIQLQDVTYVKTMVSKNQFLHREDIEAISVELSAASDDVDEVFRRLDEKKLRVGGSLITLQDVEQAKKIYRENKNDYISALTSGHSDRVYAALLGVPVKYKTIKQDIRLEDLLTDFASGIATNFNIQMELGNDSCDFDKIKSGLNDISRAVIVKIFGEDLDANQQEVIYFLRTVNSGFYSKAAQLLVELKPEKKSSVKKDVHQELKRLFSNALDESSAPIPENIKRSLESKLHAFVDKEIPHKRGLNKYTTAQIETFDYIKDALQRGQLLSLSTKENVGSSVSGSRLFSPANEPRSKGLAGCHSYQIVNCYERNGTKVVLVKNPWATYVRDYEYTTKTIGNQRVNVLSAVPKLQLGSFSFFYTIKHKLSYLLGFKDIDKENLRSDPISNAALPMPAKLPKNFEKNGYFELTLEDVTKRCDSIRLSDHKIAISPSTPPRSRKMIISYINYLLILANLPEHVRKNQASITNLMMNTLKINQSTQDAVKVDANSILAIYHHLQGRSEASRDALKRVGANWELDDAILHLQRLYQTELPQLRQLDSLLSEDKKRATL